MGDILHALPAITALRQAHPGWHIGWVVDPRWLPLLRAGNEESGEQGSQGARSGATQVVDQLHFAPSREWKRQPFSRKTLQSIRGLRRELRAVKYDAVIDLQGAIRSAVIARMTGSARRIGEAKPREWPAHWLFTERVATHGAHVIEQDLELAATIAGDALQAMAPLLPVDPAAEEWCAAWMAELAASRNARPLAFLSPGAGWGAKRWPPERYAAVARGLKERGFQVLVNAPPGEDALAAPIVADGASVPVSVTLPQLIALMRRIRLFVGGDTGPLHLAAALERPVVGLYGPTEPGRNGPFGTRARVLRSPLSRRDYSHRDAPDPGLLTITPEDVLQEADALLAEVKTA